MSNKMKSSFKPPILVSQSSSQSQVSESLGVVVVKQEDEPATVKIATKDVGNGKQKSSKSAKSKKDVNKENVPPHGIASAPKNGQKKSSADATPHTSKPTVDNPSKKRKHNEAAKPFRPMNDAEYEDIFSSVIAANACEDDEEGELEEVPMKKAKVSRVAKPKPPPMKISNLDEAAYDDIFASAIAKKDYDRKDSEAATSTNVVTASKKHKKMPLESLNPIKRKTTPVILDLIEEVAEEIFDVDDNSDQDDDGEVPMDFGSEDVVDNSIDEEEAAVPHPDDAVEGDPVRTPPNSFQPSVDMLKPAARVVPKLKSANVRRRLFSDEERADSDPQPLNADDGLELGASCLNPPLIDQRPVATAAQKSSGFKVPLLHRSQGTSASSKGSKASNSKASNSKASGSKASSSKQLESGKLKRGPSSKANKLPITKKKPKVSVAPSASQSSQRSNTSLHPSQTLSQVDAPAHSQPPAHLNPRERLEWLQERRDIGLWVVCDKCDKNRYLPDVKDPLDLPDEWFCRMHPDPSLNDCSYPEDGPSLVEQDDMVHNLYTSGSVVWARLDGFPWWPAMVDDCPDVEAYYWLNDFSDIPTHYNVTFFDKDSATRAWMLPSQLQPFTGNERGRMFKSAAYGENYSSRLAAAKSQATEALSLTIAERRKKFSFLARYKGKIAPLRKITVAKIRKELAKMQKGSHLKLSQMELSLLREADADESSSESASDSVSEFEEERRKNKETQKKTKKRKHSSTAQKKSRPTKTSNGGMTSSEKNGKKKTSKAPVKRAKFVESKQSSAESDDQSSSQDESEKSDSEEAEEQRESLGSETYCSLVKNAKLQAAKEQSGAQDNEEAESEGEAEKSSEEEAEKSDEEEEAEKSDNEEAEKIVSAVGAMSPFSERSNSPSLLSTPVTEDPSQSQKVVEEDPSQAKTTSQTQRSTQLSYEECSMDNTSQDPTWLPNATSENAVVPTSSDPQADLDFSQELFDAVVPDVGSSSAISEPYSSEADMM